MSCLAQRNARRARTQRIPEWWRTSSAGSSPSASASDVASRGILSLSARNSEAANDDISNDDAEQTGIMITVSFITLHTHSHFRTHCLCLEREVTLCLTVLLEESLYLDLARELVQARTVVPAR